MRTPISLRAGAAWRAAACAALAKKKPIPISRIALPKCSTGKSIRTPSASITSAEPLPECDARLPCFATRAPAAAATMAAAVEILNVANPLPPVPHVSTRCRAAPRLPQTPAPHAAASRLRNPRAPRTRTGRAFIAVSSRTISAVSTLPAEQLFHHRFRFSPREDMSGLRPDQLAILSSRFGSIATANSAATLLRFIFPSTLLCLRRHENSNTTEPR